MEDIQQSELIFYLPVIVSYAIACIAVVLTFKKKGLWNATSEFSPKKPWLELLLALLAVIGIFMIGRFYSAGYLVPSNYNPWAWVLNNFIIYSPIFIVAILRKQPFVTLWISNDNLWFKIVVGLLASILSVFIFIILRGEAERGIQILTRAFTLETLSNFPAVFFEGVALAFLFVRLKWVSNLKIALSIPAILFAAGHLPGMITDGDPWWHMLLMSMVTGSITVFVLYTCHKVKDIVWLGLVHYFMDIAIKAF